MRIRALVSLSFLMLLVAAQPAGAGGGGHGRCAGFTRGAEISMQDACFQGTAHIADAGSTITVTNDGQIPHDFTAADGSFASGSLQPGASFELTVQEPGAIPFYCTLHGTATGDGMAGVLLVEDAVSATGRSTSQAAAARSGPSTPVGDRQATSALGAATVSRNGSADTWLAVGALLLSSIALAVALRRVRAPAAAVRN